jgi:hypothetical protein
VPLSFRLAKWLLGPTRTAGARRALRGLPDPEWGNLRRLQPFSTHFGFERGTPIDRYYMDAFLHQWSTDISGVVLEIQTGDTARRYGRSLQRVDTLDINGSHRPTYHCDLAASGDVVPDGTYDCFLMPSTLPFLRDLDQALVHALRVLKPGGVILAPTPVLGQIDTSAPDYWRLNIDGWQRVADRVWPSATVTIAGYGNCLAATAAIMGLAAEELTPAELDAPDPRFPVLAGIRCRKPAAGTR